MGGKNVEIAISLGFSIIGLVLQYLSEAGVDEALIEENWAFIKAEKFKRPSEKLPIPKVGEE